MLIRSEFLTSSQHLYTLVYRSLLHHADPRFLALADLPPSHAAVLGPVLRGCFGEGGRQLTPLGLAAEARRLLQANAECL